MIQYTLKHNKKEILQVTKRKIKNKKINNSPPPKNQTPHFPQWVNETNLSSDWLSLIPIAHTDNGI